jgi:hypothetical protein
MRRMRTVADEGESRKTLVETTAESIQRAFTVCLTERSSNRNGIGRDGRPEGKKIGIYSFANMVLRLLFQVLQLLFINLPILTLFTVPQVTSLQSTLHQYHTELSTSWSLPRLSTRNLLILSWPIPLLQQPLLLRTGLSHICIFSVPWKMYLPTSPYSHLSPVDQHNSRPLPPRSLGLSSRGFLHPP